MKTDFNESFVSKHTHPAYWQKDEADDEAVADAKADALAEWKAMRQEVLIRVLDLLSAAATTPKKAYRLIHVLKHITRPEGSQSDLARRLEMDKGELSKVFNALTEALANLNKLKGFIRKPEGFVSKLKGFDADGDEGGAATRCATCESFHKLGTRIAMNILCHD